MLFKIFFIIISAVEIGDTFPGSANAHIHFKFNSFALAKSIPPGFEAKSINNVSSLTHSHEISRLGCKIYVDYVKLLLDGVDKFDAFNRLIEIDYAEYYTREIIDEYRRILSGDIVNLSRDEIKSSGYVVDTLEASLWSFLNTDNYKDAVLTAINLGGDTDTIGAITGSMGGIVYGGKQIPREWLYKLKKRDYINDMCKKFVDCLKNDKVIKHR